MNLPLLIGMMIVYMADHVRAGVSGNKQTKTAEDYLVAGRRIHPVVMALSYGRRLSARRPSSDSAGGRSVRIWPVCGWPF